MATNTTEFANLRKAIFRLDLGTRRSLLNDGLAEIGNLVAAQSQLQMKRGGSARPLPDKLTSRTGTGRRSIRSDRPALNHVDIGTDLRYMAAHESGGTFWIKQHKRRSKLGNLHDVKAHSMTLPKRSFLEPGLEASRPGIERIFERLLIRVIETA